jgi:hypothetical protein
MRTIRKRTRFFLAGEGESEQSFIRWLQLLSDGSLSVHLDSYTLGGGGYRTMLEDAVNEHRRRVRSRGPYEACFLIVDGDRAGGQEWTIEELREKASKHGFTVVIQRPNYEGLLYRMSPGKERDIPSASTAQTKLRTFWETYKKPVNAQMLKSHFTLDDLLRLARVDNDIESMVRTIGLL